MARKLNRILFICVLLFELRGVPAVRAEEPAGKVDSSIKEVTTSSGCPSRLRGRVFGRTELFFGRARANGSMITDQEFRGFLDDVVTPRFPLGLTVLAARGQFRGSSGLITREDALFLILLYPLTEPDSDWRIEEIRTAYRDRFQQESVLRIDDHSCVSF
jgi:hypothetical protein